MCGRLDDDDPASCVVGLSPSFVVGIVVGVVVGWLVSAIGCQFGPVLGECIISSVGAFDAVGPVGDERSLVDSITCRIDDTPSIG